MVVCSVAFGMVVFESVCVLERFGFGFLCSVSCRFLYTRDAGFLFLCWPFFVLLKYVSFEALSQSLLVSNFLGLMGIFTL